MQGAWSNKTNLKKTNLENSHLPITNLVQRYSNQDSTYWQKVGHTDQWNRIRSPEINPYIYNQLVFDRGTKTIQIVFSVDGTGTTGYLYVKE